MFSKLFSKVMKKYRVHQVRRKLRKLEGYKLITEGPPVGEYSYLVVEEVERRRSK